jgi:hypothetical protein
MEDVIYDSVNDYYQFFSTSDNEFSHPEINFTSSSSRIEYSRVIWAKFLEKRFSRSIIKRIFEYMRKDSSISAMQKALAEYGSSFREAFIEYAFWNFQTGPDCDTIKYYNEGRKYPSMDLPSPTHYSNPATSITDTLHSISNKYFPVEVDNYQMFVIVSHIDIATAYSDQSFNFTYEMQGKSDSTFKHLQNGLSVRLSATSPDQWYSWESIPTVTTVQVERTPLTFQLAQNFPNPFNPTTNISFNLPTRSFVSLKVFDLIGREVTTIISDDLPMGNYLKQWSANGVASGVYFYRLQAGTFTETRKLVLLR